MGRGKPVVLGFVVAVVVACSSSGGTNPACKVVAKGYIGGADDCEIIADCIKTQQRMYCSKSDGGACDCTVNGSVTKSVPFDPALCAYSADAGNDPNVQQARAACGW